MIIGLSGYARAGKNEAAKGLEPLGYKSVAFADKLREFLYVLNPVVIPRVKVAFGPLVGPELTQDIIDKYGWDGYKETPWGDHLREYMQRLGTECGRGLLYDSVWVDATLNNVSGDVVVTDCRFPNEARAIKSRGGIVIRIEKTGLGPINDHPSETALDGFNWDYVVWNDHSIDELHWEVREIVTLHS
jgi:hypothetical protein